MGETMEFTVELDPVGFSTVKIAEEGGDLADVSELVQEVQINSGRGGPTTLFLKQKPGAAVVTGSGVVYIQKERIDAQHVIEMIDPEELNTACLDKQEWGDQRNFAEIVLSEILERIHAAQSGPAQEIR